jgi:uncharacterized membrane protein
MTDTDETVQQTDMTAESTSGTGNLEIAVNIFASPSEAFRVLQIRPTVLFPLLVTMLATVLVYMWYFSMVDYAWYVDDTVARMGGNMTEQQQEGMRNAMSGQSQTFMTVSGTLGGAIAIVFIYALQAGYLTLVSALTGQAYRFKSWFSLVCWTSLPYLLVVLVMAVNIVLSPNGQLSLYDANSLSLASLGFSASNNFMLENVLNSLNLPMFWSMALTVMGYQQWLQSGYLKATLVVLAPYLVIFGILAYFAFT